MSDFDPREMELEGQPEPQPVDPLIRHNINVTMTVAKGIEMKSYGGSSYKKFWKKISESVSVQCNEPNNWLTGLIGTIILTAGVWLLAFCLLHKEVVPPKGGLFLLIALVIVAYIVGWVVSFAKLPPLLGMLITGIAAKSIGIFNIDPMYEKIVDVSRDVALTVILVKAGLGLDPVALKKNVGTILALAVCPCVVEASTAAVATHFFFDFPWLWSFLLGFLLSPISPAVVVPTLLSLKERGYGEEKGIATTVIAASSLDDIVSISLFSIFLGLTFNTGSSLVYMIFDGPIELVAGILTGSAWGLVSAFFPNRNDSNVNVKRSFMVGVGGLLAVIGSKQIGFQAAGTLTCITAAFVSNLCWRSQALPEKKNRVGDVFSAIWLVMQPTLFGLIGTEIDLSALNGLEVAYGLSVLAVCLTFRVISCFLVLLMTNLTWKERLFVNLAWLPKATVQAALSPQALEKVRHDANHSDDDEYRAKLILTTAVIAILVTAPLGSIGITLSGTRLLTRKSSSRPV